MSTAPAAAPAAPAKKKRNPRNGLRTSATLATIFVIVGHAFFGFEQSVAQVLVALATGYTCALGFEWIDATVNGRKPGFLGGGLLHFGDWLLSAHMTSITMTFLLYSNRHLGVMALAVALAIGSKYLFRVRQKGRMRHFLNPSNFGLAMVLLVFQWSGSLPWGMTAWIFDWQDFFLPLFVCALGFRLNLLYTGRLPLIFTWLGVFALQGLGRSLYTGSPLVAELYPMTGVAFMLFTFYMITDPMTSPSKPRNQVIFGASIGLCYGVLMFLGVQWTLFFAVVLVSAVRGGILYYAALQEDRRAARAAPEPSEPSADSLALAAGS